MKKKIRVIIFTLLLCFVLFVFNPHFIMVVDAAAPITIENWDSYTVGAKSGSSGYGSWNDDGSSNYEVTDSWSYSGSKSYRDVKPTSDYAWYNITAEFDYVGRITIYGRFYYNEGINGDTANHSIYFKNNNNVINYFRILAYTSGAQCHASFSIFNYDYTEKLLLGFSGVESSITFDYKLVITHDELNTFNYSLYNQTDDYIDSVDTSGRYVETHTTYDSLKFFTSGGYNHPSSSNTFYIDDIAINTTYTGPPGDLPEGYLGVNCYNENTSENITDFDVLFINQEGETYYDYDVDNTYIVWGAALPQGETLLTVSKTGFYPRSYNFVVGDNYFIVDGVTYDSLLVEAYLCPINLSFLYYIQVIDEYNNPIEDARVRILGFCGNESYENVSSTLTDSYGFTNVYLMWGRQYQVTINKTGYITKTEFWIPDPSYYGINYPKIFTLRHLQYDYQHIMDNLTYDIQPEIRDHTTNITFYYNMTSTYSELEWTRINVYQYNYTTEIWDHLFMDTNTTSSGGSITFTTNNTTGLYGLKCEFKRENLVTYTFYGDWEGLFLYTIYNVSNETIIEDIDTIDELIDENIGQSPVYWQDQVVAWSSLGAAFSVMMVMFTFSPKMAGFAVMSVGAILGFFKAPLGLISDDVVSMVTIVIIFILGIIVVITGGKNN